LLSRLKVDKLIMSRASFMVTPGVDKFALNFTNREILRSQGGAVKSCPR